MEHKRKQAGETYVGVDVEEKKNRYWKRKLAFFKKFFSFPQCCQTEICTRDRKHVQGFKGLSSNRFRILGEVARREAFHFFFMPTDNIIEKIIM